MAYILARKIIIRRYDDPDLQLVIIDNSVRLQSRFEMLNSTAIDVFERNDATGTIGFESKFLCKKPTDPGITLCSGDQANSTWEIVPVSSGLNKLLKTEKNMCLTKSKYDMILRAYYVQGKSCSLTDNSQHWIIEDYYPKLHNSTNGQHDSGSIYDRKMYPRLRSAARYFKSNPTVGRGLLGRFSDKK